MPMEIPMKLVCMLSCGYTVMSQTPRPVQSENGNDVIVPVAEAVEAQAAEEANPECTPGELVAGSDMTCLKVLGTTDKLEIHHKQLPESESHRFTLVCRPAEPSTDSSASTWCTMGFGTGMSGGGNLSRVINTLEAQEKAFEIYDKGIREDVDDFVTLESPVKNDGVVSRSFTVPTANLIGSEGTANLIGSEEEADMVAGIFKGDEASWKSQIHTQRELFTLDLSKKTTGSPVTGSAVVAESVAPVEAKPQEQVDAEDGTQDGAEEANPEVAKEANPDEIPESILQKVFAEEANPDCFWEKTALQTDAFKEAGGNIIEGSPNVPSAAECNGHCSSTKDSTCKFWTWLSSSQKCYLLSSKGEGKPSSDATSGASGSKDCNPVVVVDQVNKTEVVQPNNKTEVVPQPEALQSKYSFEKTDMMVRARDNGQNEKSKFELKEQTQKIILHHEANNGEIFSTCPKESSDCTYGTWGMVGSESDWNLVVLKKIGQDGEEDEIIKAVRLGNANQEDLVFEKNATSEEYFTPGEYQVSFDEEKVNNANGSNTAFIKLTVRVPIDCGSFKSDNNCPAPLCAWTPATETTPEICSLNCAWSEWADDASGYQKELGPWEMRKRSTSEECIKSYLNDENDKANSEEFRQKKDVADPVEELAPVVEGQESITEVLPVTVAPVIKELAPVVEGQEGIAVEEEVKEDVTDVAAPVEEPSPDNDVCEVTCVGSINVDNNAATCNKEPICPNLKCTNGISTSSTDDKHQFRCIGAAAAQQQLAAAQEQQAAAAVAAAQGEALKPAPAPIPIAAGDPVPQA